MDILRPSREAALAAWAERVRRNHAETEQVREPGRTGDFFAPFAERFRADPDRTDDPALNILRSFAQPGDTWLDIGAGGGRFALALARTVQRVIALEPSPGMLGVLRSTMAEYAVANVDIIEESWPYEPHPPADVALISQVGYTTEDIEPFLDGMERAASRTCLALLQWQAPSSEFDSLWPEVHGLTRTPLPGLAELLTVQIARGKTFAITATPGRVRSWPAIDQAQAFIRTQLWVQESSAKDERLGAALRERLTERNGRVALSWEPSAMSVLSWDAKQ